MPSRYLVQFAQAHEEFRLPELQSISELNGFTIQFLDDPECNDPKRPFMVLELENEEQARLLARRCILVKAVYDYYGHGSTYEALHEVNRSSKPKWEQYIPDTSFKFIVSGFNHTIPQRRQRDVIESFAYMDFLGEINMKTPQILLACFEEYDESFKRPREEHAGDGGFRQLYFGRLLEEGTARPLVNVFDVKKRKYFGNTSMEAEISLLMANQTMASPGKLMYDPFIGTGSMAYPTAHFGSLMFGSDIDGRQMRGKTYDHPSSNLKSEPGVFRAAKQYGVDGRILDLATFDMTNHPWRCGGFFDAIITDPPYGRLGRKRELSDRQKELCRIHREAPQPEDTPYIPPTKPYELSHLVSDLILFARYLLKPEGRLVFFLPTVNDEYEEVDVHNSLCEGMEVIANSLQDFGSWGRRLITIRKTTLQSYPPPTFEAQREESHTPAHKDFREKYFQGFKAPLSEPSPLDSPKLADQ
ncbi:RNA methylase [Coprinellus micaceus]|uniref:tRNA (guanine(10)-N(2))-methyltransferase n=1 Tax=Coprinellus micaceus TaxID=71717 RepID=A0A4Y7TXG0_COPMI|nr:RNA methylase [Coprinellus micaceus]